MDNLVGKMVSEAAAIIITAVVCSLVLLIFGEIIPQSVFLQHGMRISSQTRYFFYALWYFTYPVSLPISKILDAFMGHDKPKNSNQILSLREHFYQIIACGVEQNIKLLLYGLNVKDSIHRYVSEDFRLEHTDEERLKGVSDQSNKFTIYLRKRPGNSLIKGLRQVS